MASSSFKSSVGSKSTNLRLSGVPDDGDLLVGYHQERRQQPRSFWISRLQLPFLDLPLPTGAPPPQQLRERVDSEGAGARACDRGAISTDESRSPTKAANPGSAFVARRYLNLIEERRPGARPPWSLLPPPPPPVVYDDGEERRQAGGFGPFQVRAVNAVRHTGLEGSRCGPSQTGEGVDSQWVPNSGFSHGRKLESVELAETFDQRNKLHRTNEMNMSFHNQPPATTNYSRDRDKGPLGRLMDEGSTKQFENWTHRWTAINDKGPSPSAGEVHQIHRVDERQASFGPWHVNASVQTGAISRAAAHGIVGVDDAPTTSFCEHRFRHDSLTKQRLEHCLDKKNEHDEPFSFWKLGKFNKGNVVSSSDSTTTVSSNLNRKRNAYTQAYFQSSKLRKM